MGNASASLKVSSAIVENKQSQITISGLPKEAQGGKGKAFKLDLALTDKDGAQHPQGSLVLGDTHCIWKSHQQTEEQKGLFDKMYAFLAKNPGVSLPVVVTSYEQISGSAQGGGQAFDISELLG